MKLLYLLVIFFVVSAACLTSTLLHRVFAEPVIDVSPTCGPHEPGFNIVINGNGFLPNSIVAYKFVGFDSTIPLYGYFETNSAGSFSDVTFADDLKEDSYKLYFADDANNDNVFDIGAERVYANVTIPCPVGGGAPLMPVPENSQIQWLNVCKSIEWGLMNSCSTYVNPDGSLTLEGERAKNCISNGALISGVGAIGFELPIPVIIGALEPAAKLSGCDNIVDFVTLKQSPDASSLLRALGIR